MIRINGNANPLDVANQRLFNRRVAKEVSALRDEATTAKARLDRNSPRMFLANLFASVDLYTLERPNVELMLWWGWNGTAWNTVHRAETLAYIADLGGEVFLDYEADEDLRISRLNAERLNIPDGVVFSHFCPFVAGDVNLGWLKVQGADILPTYEAAVTAIEEYEIPPGFGICLDCYMGVGGDFDGWWLRVAERLRVWKLRGVPITAFISHREAADPGEDLLTVDVFRAMAQAIVGAGCDVAFWQDAASDAYSVIEPYWIAYLEVAKKAAPGFRSSDVFVSPNGHYWEVTVDNAGAIVTTDLGTSPP